VNWKLLTAAMLVVFLAVGCGAPKTTVTLHNSLGEWKITSLTLKGPGDAETTLEAMLPDAKVELQLAHGSYTLNATDEEGHRYRVAFTVAAEAMTVKIDFVNSLGFDDTIEVLDGVYWSGSGDGLIRIVNNLGDYPLYWVSVVEAGGDLYWDADEYCQSIIVYGGEELNILIAPGTYDIQIEDIDGDTYTRYGIEVTRDAYHWEVGLGDMDEWTDYDYDYLPEEGTAPVTIHNDLGSWDIWYIYCDLSTDPWGTDRLGSQILYAGDEFTFHVAPGRYDLRCEDVDGDTYTRWGVDIPASGLYWSVSLDQMD